MGTKSAKGRGAVVAEREYYPTPAWCTHRLLDAIGEQLRGTDPEVLWLEPCCGNLAIVNAVDEWYEHRFGVDDVPTWFLNDIIEYPHGVPQHVSDYSDRTQSFAERFGRFHVGMTNPPF